jgi:photosystem II stability/assembly factor-like uncharacterized protein
MRTSLQFLAVLLLLGVLNRAAYGARAWTPSSPDDIGSQGGFVIADPLSDDVLYASADAGLAKSIDGGHTWVLIPLEGHKVRAAAFTSVPSPALFVTTSIDVGSSTHEYLQRSDDGGSTWTKREIHSPICCGSAVSPGFSQPFLAIDPVTAGIAYLAIARSCFISCSGGGVIRTSDGGQTWTHAGLSEKSILNIQTDPSISGTAYAIVENAQGDHQLHRTADFGSTWTQLIPHIQTLSIDPTQSGTLYVTQRRISDCDVLRSEDGGSSWTSVSHIADISVSALTVDPATPTTIAWCDYFSRMVQMSLDGGVTWSDISSGLNYDNGLATLMFTNHDRLFGTSFTLGVMAFRDVTWRRAARH